MRSREDEVTAGVNHLRLGDGITAPQKEHQPASLLGEGAYGGIGKRFPTFALMRARLMGTDGESGVEKEDSLLGPTSEVTTFGRDCGAEVTVYLLDDVHQRGRNPDTITDGEAQTVCLTWLVVGVLSYDDGFHLVEWGKVEGVEYIASSGVALVLLTLCHQEFLQLFEIGSLELRTQYFKP